MKAYSYIEPGKYGKIRTNAFCKSDKGRKSKSRATNSIIDSILNVGSHKQQVLALNDAFKHPNLIDQATDCGYFWKERDKVHSGAVNNLMTGKYITS